MSQPPWPSAVLFDIIDEIGASYAVEQMLHSLGPAIVNELSQVIGPQPGSEPPAIVKVLLSDTATHDARFPPRVEPALGEPDPEDPHGGPTLGAIFTLGVTTTGAGVTNRPPGVADDDLVIALNLERLSAGHRGCGPDAAIAETFIHETAHVWQRIAELTGTAWFREGDAQRTTWEVLKRLVRDLTHRDLARRAQTMMLRLAPSQPAAYRTFPYDPTHYYRVQHGPLPDRSSWMVQTADLHQSVDRQSSVVVPDAIQFGDTVYLSDSEQYIGPFVVTERVGDDAVLVPDGKTRRGLNPPANGRLLFSPTPTEDADAESVRLHQLESLLDPITEALKGSDPLNTSLPPGLVAMFDERDELQPAPTLAPGCRGRPHPQG